MISTKRSISRRWLIPIAIFVLLFLVLFIAGQFTPVITAWILRQPIDAWNFKPPPNFEAIKESLVVEENIIFDGHGTLMDIYRPKAGSAPLPVVVWIHGGGFIGGSKENTRAYAMTLAVGDADALEPQSLELKDILEENGVEVESVLFTGTGADLGHDYMMNLDSEPAQRTLQRALGFLERHSRPQTDITGH